jgi:hypothetical protein
MLEDYIDGALDGGSTRKLTEHLKVCVGCSQALDVASGASEWLRQAEPVADPGPAFARIVMARIRAEEETPGRASFWEPFVSLAWKFATTAALALVVMLAYASRGTNSATSNVASVGTQSEVPDMLVAGQSTAPATRSEMILMVTESDNAER